MRHVAKRFAVVLQLSLVGVALVVAHASGQGGQSPLMPPQSHAFGKAFEEWNVLYSQWVLESLFGGGTDLSDTVGHVRFLPVPAPAETGCGSCEIDVTLRPGTPFVASPFFVWGESYDDPSVPDDNPADPLLDTIFKTTEIRVELDGRVLMAGTGTELERFRYGPVYFDEPIVYAEPVPRGEGLNATSALFVAGIGVVYRPLPVGQHTLVHTVHSEFLERHYQFTYHTAIPAEPPSPVITGSAALAFRKH